jgi:phosphoglucan,water dikinase
MLIPLDLTTPSVGGGKAYGARRLWEIADTEGAGFRVPGGLVIPFGVMEAALRSNSALSGEYASLTGDINRASRSEQDVRLRRLSEIITQLTPPAEVLSGVARHLRKDSRLMVRSSSNCEDAEGMAGAGIYDSVANVPLSEAAVAVTKVWASLWNRRALDARRNAGIPHEACHMAVLIQPIIPADISLVMHTVNPVSGNKDEILIELAVGLGETLVSGREPGSPFRMVYHKKTGDLQILSFASYSFFLRPAGSGGTIRERVDYSAIPFSRDSDFRRELAIRIGKAGGLVEHALGRPQDIEGAVKGEEIYLVQARPQQTDQRTGRKECPT